MDLKMLVDVATTIYVSRNKHTKLSDIVDEAECLIKECERRLQDDWIKIEDQHLPIGKMLKIRWKNKSTDDEFDIMYVDKRDGKLKYEMDCSVIVSEDRIKNIDCWCYYQE